MAKVQSTVVAGGKGKAVASKDKPAKKASKVKGTFAFRQPVTKGPAAMEVVGGMKACEFGKVRVADLPASQAKLNVLATLVDKCKGEASPPEIVAASGGKVNGKQSRHYCYHAEAGGLVKRSDGADCKGTARFTITAAGRKEVTAMKGMKFESKAVASKDKPAKKASKATK